ncbi:MAG: hypothetical protein C0468_05795 [Planctomyces sp.]|nr:hypothetical protein [Planctomyces sp.]
MLECDQVVAGYGRRPERGGVAVLGGVSVRAEPGSVTAVLGPNGAGKTTLLRVLAGVHEPWSGAVRAGGRLLGSLTAGQRAARVAYVGQRSVVAGWYRVGQVVAMGCASADWRAVGGALHSVGLSGDQGERLFAELSAGQQQRAALARGLAQLWASDGASLLLDEPTAAQDPAQALRVQDALRQWVERGRSGGAGRAVLAAMHDLTAARRWADRAVVLDGRGGVAAQGPTRDVVTPGVLGPVFGVRFEWSRDAAGEPVGLTAHPGDAAGIGTG